MRAILLALVAVLAVLLLAGAPRAQVRETTYTGLEEQNQPVRLVLDRRARTLRFRIGYIPTCTGPGGASAGT